MMQTISKVAARLHLSLRWSRLAVLGAFPRDGIGVEIGVHLGDYAARILAAARPRKLYLVDPWQSIAGDAYKQSVYGSERSSDQEMERRYQVVLERFAKRIKRGQVCVVRKTSSQALGDLDDASLDFVYIDGNHTYQFAAEDLELALAKVKSGGVISGDDYTAGGWWQGGVKRAVDEFGWRPGVDLEWISGRQFVFRKA